MKLNGENDMSEIKFDGQPGLGAEVSNVKPFCKLTKNMDVPAYEDVVGVFTDKNKPGLAGKKFSRLCGFTFKTNSKIAPTEIFQIVFVPKLKGPITRNRHGLSGWYCWMVLPNGDRNVVSISDMKRKYNFDVNGFFKSDLFDHWLPMFKSNISYVLDNQIKELLNKETDADRSIELKRHIDAIKNTLHMIDDVKQIVTYDSVRNDSNDPSYAKGSAPKVGNAKLAYNADKTYRLKDLDKNKSYRRIDYL